VTALQAWGSQKSITLSMGYPTECPFITLTVKSVPQYKRKKEKKESACGEKHQR
jgi:hypothetical protein